MSSSLRGETYGFKLTIPSTFKPAWWLRNRHAQTIWPSLFRKRPKISLLRERLELPDGDFLDLDWTESKPGPIVLLLHGLEGNAESHYTKSLLKHLSQLGSQAVIMYFRGCNGEMNRLPRAYHSGETGDLNYVVSQLTSRFPDRRIYTIGISLGGNVLLKWLGETGHTNPLSGAIAISVPFDLANAAEQLNHRGSRIYQRHLVDKLQRSLKQRLAHMDLPIDKDKALSCKTIRQYDDLVTAPLHGFKNSTDYYAQSSSRPFLAAIRIPTLILHAKDDPFMTCEAIPTADELSDKLSLELTESGGHVGFISGRLPLRPRYWLEQRISRFFAELV